MVKKITVPLKITYDPNGGTFRDSTDPTTEEYNLGNVVKIAEAATRDGYVFLYWKGSEFDPRDKYLVEGDHTFVAQWEKHTDKDKTHKKTKVKSKKKSPQTGDGNTMLLWYLTMAAAQMLLIGLLRMKTKKD